MGINIDAWIRPQIKKLNAYHIPIVNDVIKLDAMENPYVWPEDLVSLWLQSLASASLNRYPDPQANGLKQSIRDAMCIPDDTGLLLGNGSDEIIQMILMAVAEPDRTVLAPEPTFVMYEAISQALGMNYIGVPLDKNFALDLDVMLTMIKDHNPAVIFLAYPNNPTGNLFERDAVTAIIQASNGLVVLDEAYAAFTHSTFMGALHAHPNLLVMRTLSKMGLAGLRIGYLAGDIAWLNEFEKIRLPYNINVLSQVSAQFALQHIAVLNEQSQRIVRDRAYVFQAMQKMSHLQVFPTDANFIMFKIREGDAHKIYKNLLNKGILVKNLSASNNPVLQNCLRVTIGTAKENESFLAALKTEVK